MKKEKKQLNIVIIILLLIISGLMIDIFLKSKKIKDYKSIIEEKNKIIEQQCERIIKLNTENENFWNNYYTNVSNYKGYEYYE